VSCTRRACERCEASDATGRFVRLAVRAAGDEKCDTGDARDGARAAFDDGARESIWFID